MYINKEKYYGIIPPVITPINGKGDLDYDAYSSLIEFLLHQGVHGVFAMGSSGEAMMTSKETWKEAIQASVKLTQGRTTLFCGVIDSSTVRVIENIKIAEDVGAEIFVVTPSFYIQNSCQDEIIRQFEKVASSTKNSIVMYNIPGMTHANIAPQTARKIAEIDNVIAIKDSSANWEDFQRMLFLLEDRDIAVFNGAEELCSAAMIFGAQGCVPGLANFFPKLFVDLYHAGKAGDINTTYRLQKDCWEIRKSLFVGKHWLSAMKYLGNKMGFGSKSVSDPIEPLTEKQLSQIDLIVDRYLT